MKIRLSNKRSSNTSLFVILVGGVKYAFNYDNKTSQLFNIVYLTPINPLCRIQSSSFTINRLVWTDELPIAFYIFCTFLKHTNMHQSYHIIIHVVIYIYFPFGKGIVTRKNMSHLSRSSSVPLLIMLPPHITQLTRWKTATRWYPYIN